MIRDKVNECIEEIKLAMYMKNITREELADKIGMSRATVGNILNKKNFNLDTLEKIEEVVKEWN